MTSYERVRLGSRRVPGREDSMSKGLREKEPTVPARKWEAALPLVRAPLRGHSSRPCRTRCPVVNLTQGLLLFHASGREVPEVQPAGWKMIVIWGEEQRTLQISGLESLTKWEEYGRWWVRFPTHWAWDLKIFRGAAQLNSHESEVGGKVLEGSCRLGCHQPVGGQGTFGIMRWEQGDWGQGLGHVWGSSWGKAGEGRRHRMACWEGWLLWLKTHLAYILWLFHFSHLWLLPSSLISLVLNSIVCKARKVMCSQQDCFKIRQHA